MYIGVKAFFRLYEAMGDATVHIRTSKRIFYCHVVTHSEHCIMNFILHDILDLLYPAPL